MKKHLNKLVKIAINFTLLLFSIIGISFINHKIQLTKESELLVATGRLVDVKGQKIHVYQEGEASTTLVFMAGGGTSSPVLDFKSLYSLFIKDYKIAVVEKFAMVLVMILIQQGM